MSLINNLTYKSNIYVPTPMHMGMINEIQDCTSNADLKYLEVLFPYIPEMHGTIVHIDGYEEHAVNNYADKIKNPFMEETLILIERKSVILFFKHSENKVRHETSIAGVRVYTSMQYNNSCSVLKKRKPADVPNDLAKYIFEEETIVDMLGKINIKDDFFDRNYTKGGMISLKEMKRHPEWKNEYRNSLDIKKVHVCKSCKKKWYKKCCAEYSRTNRTMLQMVIGWNKDT